MRTRWIVAAAALALGGGVLREGRNDLRAGPRPGRAPGCRRAGDLVRARLPPCSPSPTRPRGRNGRRPARRARTPTAGSRRRSIRRGRPCPSGSSRRECPGSSSTVLTTPPRACACRTSIVPAPATVSGVIAGADGKPVSGARVVVRQGAGFERDETSFFAETTTGADGAFKIANAPPGAGAALRARERLVAGRARSPRRVGPAQRRARARSRRSPEPCSMLPAAPPRARSSVPGRSP